MNIIIFIVKLKMQFIFKQSNLIFNTKTL